jgi:hypothetical protein
MVVEREKGHMRNPRVMRNLLVVMRVSWSLILYYISSELLRAVYYNYNIHSMILVRELISREAYETTSQYNSVKSVSQNSILSQMTHFLVRLEWFLPYFTIIRNTVLVVIWENSQDRLFPRCIFLHTFFYNIGTLGISFELACFRPV